MRLSLVWVVALIFMVLKLTHYIDWPWWKVFAPVWLCGCLAIVLYGIWGMTKLAGRR